MTNILVRSVSWEANQIKLNHCTPNSFPYLETNGRNNLESKSFRAKDNNQNCRAVTMRHHFPTNSVVLLLNRLPLAWPLHRSWTRLRLTWIPLCVAADCLSFFTCSWYLIDFYFWYSTDMARRFWRRARAVSSAAAITTATTS